MNDLEAYKRWLMERALDVETDYEPVGEDEHAEYERFMGKKLTPLEVVDVKRRLAAMLEREGKR